MNQKSNIFNEKNESIQKQSHKSQQQVLLIKPSTINEHFQCGICQGYIIDATTITECLHSFCKSCIVHFIKTIDPSCPTCNNKLKSDLEHCIRADSFLQRLIYKLIPNLLESEIERRDRFYFNENLNTELIINNKTILNVKLSHLTDKTTKHAIKNLNDFEKENQINNNTTPAISQANTTKYIQCMAQTPIAILAKLIRNKYDIPTNFKIKLTYHGHRLNESENLIQVYTSFILNKDDLLNINYEIKKKKTMLKNIKNTFADTNKTTETLAAKISTNNKGLTFQKENKSKSNIKTTNKSESNSKIKISRNSTSSIRKPKTKMLLVAGSSVKKQKLSLIPPLVQNENVNLLTRYRPIRKKEDPVAEPSKNNFGVILVSNEAEQLSGSLKMLEIKVDSIDSITTKANSINDTEKSTRILFNSTSLGEYPLDLSIQKK